jgi:hypothetical protein
VSQGILDDVKFSHQTVEFIIVLSAPSGDGVWFKDGRRVAPSEHPLVQAVEHSYRKRNSQTKSKFSASVEESGQVHKLVVNDVHVEDEGIYTFRVRLPDECGDQALAKARVRYRIEGSTDQANVAALMKGLADQQPSSGTTAATMTPNIGTE